VTGNQWTATHDLRVPGITSSGTTSGRIDPDDATRTTVAGPLEVTIGSLADAAASLAPFGLELPEAARDIQGAIDADVTVAGTVGDPSAVIAARAPALELPTVGPAAIAVDIAADSRLVTIDP